MNFYWKVGIGVGALLAVAVLGVFFLSGGEEREVESALDRAVDAARKGDAEKVVEFISRGYRSDGQDYEGVTALIRRSVGPHRYQDLQLREKEITVLGEGAKVRFTIRIVRPAGSPAPFFERTIDAELRKEGGAWRVISARSEPIRLRR